MSMTAETLAAIQHMSNNTAAVPDVGSKLTISDEATRIFNWVNFMLCQAIAIFGTGANIINIICFVKQGLQDPINVSFLGLAISDLGNVVMLLWTALCCIPAFGEADLPFEPTDLQYLISSWPHAVFTRVTSWITALINLERCLCITKPLKVKGLITSKRVAVVIVCIFVIIAGGVSPIYYTSRFAWIFSPERNRTILRVVYTEDRALVEQISHSITNIFIPFTAYAIVIVCTIVLVVKLQKKAKWRLKCTAPVNADASFERDQRVAKVVVMISALFIVCFVPLCLMFMAMMVEPKISLDGPYKNTLFVFGGVSVLLADTNSATNIFIYYHMSSRYRAVFRQLFARRETSFSKFQYNPKECGEGTL